MKNLNEACDAYLNNIHNPGEQTGDWRTSLQFLSDGNKRYCENRTMPRDTNADDRITLKDGQKPFAVILTCSDSRVSPEIFFDQKHGDIFVIRNAGNIADFTALGSIEYAAGHLKTPLIVVVGHSRCGAVTGAFDGGEYPENLQACINMIAPAAKSCNDVDDAIRANIDGAVEKIKANEVVKGMGAVTLGAYYDIESGKVAFCEAN